MQPPRSDECAGFYRRYIDELPQGDIFDILQHQVSAAQDLLSIFPEERGSYRYADGKWSIREVLGHVNDAERVFAYRAMCFARKESSPLPSMEENDYVRHGNFHQRTLRDLVQEFQHQRQANILLFKSFDQATQMRRGVASDNEFTVRALVFIAAGHAEHHLQFLKDRYR